MGKCESLVAGVSYNDNDDDDSDMCGRGVWNHSGEAAAGQQHDVSVVTDDVDRPGRGPGCCKKYSHARVSTACPRQHAARTMNKRGRMHIRSPPAAQYVGSRPCPALPRQAPSVPHVFTVPHHRHGEPCVAAHLPTPSSRVMAHPETWPAAGAAAADWWSAYSPPGLRPPAPAPPWPQTSRRKTAPAR